VINRSPQASKPATTVKDRGNDWRPDSYIVKKSDTLYSIGLEYGYDYREIAAANNISEPFTIKIGQRLSFASLNNGKDAAIETQPTTYENEDGVIISPIDTGTPETMSADTTPVESAAIPVLTAPKAIREPYSLEALNRVPAVTQPTTVTSVPTTPAVEQPTPSTSAVVEGLAWTWPTQGKVIASFNEATNKGLDIAGTKGQTITASSTGKVIYAGSDLRGYGKLVIIKHNKTFLSVYAHNSKIVIKEGQTVKAGQKIAEMGDTDTNKIKLHFEIRQKGKSVDPARFLPQN
jgi:lipoprotein NlpD